MASRFHALPVDLFPDELRPAISRFNLEIEQLFGLEGALLQPVGTRRSDLSISRSGARKVHISRVTPEIATESADSTVSFGFDRCVALPPAPHKVTIKVLAGPPDQAYISIKITGETWAWNPFVFGP